MALRFKYSGSLRLKLVGSAILIEVVMLSILVWNSMRLMENNFSEQLEHRIQQLKPLLNASLAGPLLQEDLVTMKEIMQQFVGTEIRYLAIYGTDNERLMETGKPLHITELDIDSDTFDQQINIEGDTRLLRMPIRMVGQVVGSLVLEMDTGFITYAINTVRSQGLLIAGSEIIMSILLLGLVGYALTKHLLALTEAAHKMAQGDLSVRIPVRTHDEIGETALTFNQMAAQLSEDQSALLDRENKIRQLNEGLEQRVEQRTVELRAANKRLQTSLRQLNETQEQLVQAEKMAALGGLVAGVAHEINTPVGVGVTAISHLQMKVEEYTERYQSGQLTRDDFEMLLNTATESGQIVLTNLNRAAELIRSFKQVAVDQASNERRRFELKDYLEEILQSLKPRLKAGSHSVSIDCPDDIVLYTNPGALSQIITNLVMNSVIHGFDERQNGRIGIMVRVKRGGDIRLDYRDNGRGIPEAHIKKIFEPFFTTRRGEGGSGLGMHIVYNLVTQTLGGTIHCQSVPAQGATFTMNFPANLAAHQLAV